MEMLEWYRYREHESHGRLGVVPAPVALLKMGNRNPNVDTCAPRWKRDSSADVAESQTLISILEQRRSKSAGNRREKASRETPTEPEVRQAEPESRTKPGPEAGPEGGSIAGRQTADRRIDRIDRGAPDRSPGRRRADRRHARPSRGPCDRRACDRRAGRRGDRRSGHLR